MCVFFYLMSLVQLKKKKVKELFRGVCIPSLWALGPYLRSLGPWRPFRRPLARKILLEQIYE